jgi:hypothetical protein
MASEECLRNMASRLRKTLSEDFGIDTDEELLRACRETEPLDIGLFVCPTGGLEI